MVILVCHATSLVCRLIVAVRKFGDNGHLGYTEVQEVSSNGKNYVDLGAWEEASGSAR